MIFDYDIKIIVMLCQIEENKKEKCFCYWNYKSKEYEISFEENKINNYLIKRKITIKEKQKKKNEDNKDFNVKEVIHLHFIGWPDHGVPEINDAYETFEKMIQEIINTNESKPVVIHCSAGVGRTGTFVSIFNIYDCIMKQINDDSKNEIEFSIFDLVRKLKEMRRILVENINQYLYIFSFVEKLLSLEN